MAPETIRTLLLVEDEALIAMTERQLLERHGFRVLHALDGDTAIATVHRHPEIDLILMDIDLGRGIAGTEAARRILSIREVPVVFLTSHSERDYVDSVKRITRYGYVLKGSGEFVLIESINMALELFDAHATLRRENEARRLAETQLREREEQYRLLVEHAEEAVTLHAPDGTVLLMNSRAAANIGLTPADVAGKQLNELLPPAEAAAAIEGVRMAAEGRTGSLTEWEVMLPEGPRWFRSRIQPILDENGVTTSVISLSRDITDLVHRRSDPDTAADLEDSISD